MSADSETQFTFRMKPGNPSAKEKLPLWKSAEECIASCEAKQDYFYFTAFMIQAWLGEVTLRTVAEYSEKKSATKRRLQQGIAKQLFIDTFGHATDEEFPHVFESLARFGQFYDPQSKQLRKGYWAMSIESPVAGWPKMTPPASQREIAEGITFMRAVMDRLCEWLEAVVHAAMHRFSHLEPLAFDADPDKRELAILGVQQRHFPAMQDHVKAWWEWHHAEAAERFKESAKWTMLGKAMVSEQTRHQSYPGLDELVIWLWPLVRRHRWTYRDLMNVIQAVAPVPVAYPCEREQDLAAYCANVLGLRKGWKGKTSRGLPPGFEVARALSPARSHPEVS